MSVWWLFGIVSHELVEVEKQTQFLRFDWRIDQLRKFRVKSAGQIPPEELSRELCLTKSRLSLLLRVLVAGSSVRNAVLMNEYCWNGILQQFLRCFSVWVEASELLRLKGTIPLFHCHIKCKYWNCVWAERGRAFVTFHAVPFVQHRFQCDQ